MPFAKASATEEFPYRHHMFMDSVLDLPKDGPTQEHWNGVGDHIDNLALIADIDIDDYKVRFGQMGAVEIRFRTEADKENFITAELDSQASNKTVTLQFTFSAEGKLQISRRKIQSAADGIARLCAANDELKDGVTVERDKKARTIQITARCPETFLNMWSSVSKSGRNFLRQAAVRRALG